MSIIEKTKLSKNKDSHNNKTDDYLTSLLLNKFRQNEVDHLVERLLTKTSHGKDI